MTEKITTIPQLKPRAVDSHKGMYGKVLVVGGSRGMIGAPSLAGNAALRSGAGLVRMAAPGSIQLSIAQITPCATTIPLAEDDKGKISRAAVREILGALEDNDSGALGPGMGQSVELQEVMKEVVGQCQKPMVIDATYNITFQEKQAGPNLLQ